MKRAIRVVAVGLAALVAAVAARSAGGRSSAGEIVIGSSLPLTGGLAPFGALIKPGYDLAVSEVNAKGGLDVGGTKQKVKLIILDNQSNPATAGQQVRTLIQQNKAVAILGAVTPPLSIPMSAVADALKTPLLTGLTPIRAWLGGSKTGWKYAWDFFFDELKFTDQQFLTSNLTKTNKQIALFTDNEEDGQVMGALWNQKAPEFGYKIVYHAKFPVGTTDYSTFVREAKAKGAEVVITQMVPPDGVALWKQMKALNYVPKLAFCEKCGNNGAWGKILGKLAVGTSTIGYWSKTFGFPQTAKFVRLFEKKTGDTEDLSTIVSAYSGAQALFDAIVRAGSTGKDEINAAIAKTNKLYPFGRIKFNADHSAAIPSVEKQWTSPTTAKVVWPKAKANAKLIVPVVGLR